MIKITLIIKFPLPPIFYPSLLYSDVDLYEGLREPFKPLSMLKCCGTVVPDANLK